MATTQGQCSSFLDGVLEGFRSPGRTSERSQVVFGAFRRADAQTRLRSSKTPFGRGYVEAIAHEVAVVRVQPVANVKVSVETSGAQHDFLVLYDLPFELKLHSFSAEAELAVDSSLGLRHLDLPIFAECRESFMIGGFKALRGAVWPGAAFEMFVDSWT